MDYDNISTEECNLTALTLYTGPAHACPTPCTPNLTQTFNPAAIHLGRNDSQDSRYIASQCLDLLRSSFDRKHYSSDCYLPYFYNLFHPDLVDQLAKYSTGRTSATFATEQRANIQNISDNVGKIIIMQMQYLGFHCMHYTVVSYTATPDFKDAITKPKSKSIYKPGAILHSNYT